MFWLFLLSPILSSFLFLSAARSFQTDLSDRDSSWVIVLYSCNLSEMSNLYCERGSDKQLPEWVPCLCNSSFPCKYKIRVTQQKPVAQVFPLWPQWRWPGNCPYMAPFMTHTVSLRHILLKTSSLSPTEIYSTILSYCVFGDGDIYFYFFLCPDYLILQIQIPQDVLVSLFRALWNDHRTE